MPMVADGLFMHYIIFIPNTVLQSLKFKPTEQRKHVAITIEKESRLMSKNGH